MKINATEIRVGMILEYKDDLWEVLKTNHVKPGKGGAFAQIEMKSLIKNTKLNENNGLDDSFWLCVTLVCNLCVYKFQTSI